MTEVTKTQNSSPLIAANDVDFETTDKCHIRITSGTKSYTLKGTPEQIAELKVILTDILPLLRRSESLISDISLEQFETLQPYVLELLRMSVLLKSPKGINTEAKRNLFTYLARRTTNASSVYKRAREQQFRIIGPSEPVERWRLDFERQGLSVNTSDADGSIHLEVVSDEETLREQSEYYHAARISWAPVIIGPTRASLGPWVIPGETACPICPEAFDGLKSTMIRPEGSAKASWLSRQSGSLTWISGLLTHAALRIVAPAGPHSPWGRRIDIDFLRAEQETVSVWKNPYCPVCGPSPHPTRLWVEE